MKKKENFIEQVISFLESNNFQYTVDYNPSEEKIAMIKAKIAKSKKEQNPDYIFTTENGVEVKRYNY